MNHCITSNSYNWKRTELLEKCPTLIWRFSVMQSPLQAHSIHLLHKVHQTIFNTLCATLLLSSCFSNRKDGSNIIEKSKYNTLMKLFYQNISVSKEKCGKVVWKIYFPLPYFDLHELYYLPLIFCYLKIPVLAFLLFCPGSLSGWQTYNYLGPSIYSIEIWHNLAFFLSSWILVLNSPSKLGNCPWNF